VTSASWVNPQEEYDDADYPGVTSAAWVNPQEESDDADYPDDGVTNAVSAVNFFSEHLSGSIPCQTR